MGGITRETVSPAVQSVSKTVQEFPLSCNWHGETLEWIGTLKSALEASKIYRVVELGAGWAPWTAIAGRAARMRGIEDIHLLAVEGHAGNVAMARQHLRDNDFTDAEAVVRQAIVGGTDGIAEFPRHDAMSQDYGAIAMFEGADTSAFDIFIAHRPAGVELDRLPCLSLAMVLGYFRPQIVDLIRCDVQGAEEQIFNDDGLKLMSSRVRRVVVSTHSHDIERKVLGAFGRAGWVCEGMYSALMERDEVGSILLQGDGGQNWRNPAFD